MLKIRTIPMNYEEAKDKYGILGWSTWECEPSEFEWNYPDQETAFVYEGDVEVTAYGETYHITDNMMVSFPAGMECIWKVKKRIRKAYHYNVEL